MTRSFLLCCAAACCRTGEQAAKEQYQAGLWPQDWPAPPLHLALRGIDLHVERVRQAHDAVGSGAQVDLRDLRDLNFQPCAAIVILDVLFYLGETEQERVLDKVAAALEPDGLLLLRETDASAGFAFQVTKWSERLVNILFVARKVPPRSV